MDRYLKHKSDTPNLALDGYVVVFFNGSSGGADSSYLAIDLDGYTTDINGLLLIGSSSVSPIPQLIIPENTIQNGADAVSAAYIFHFSRNTPDMIKEEMSKQNIPVRRTQTD